MHGKVAVVIGGSGGIGSEICRAFAQAGATVVFTCNRGREAAAALQQNLPGTGHWAKQVAVDDSAGLKILAAGAPRTLANRGRAFARLHCRRDHRASA